MMPPTSIDGTDITGATIDGTDVQEITGAGQTVFSAGPVQPPSGVSRWTLDNADTIGTTVKDVWGNNDGTNNGATTGINGPSDTYETNEAYFFDGDDEVDCGIINEVIGSSELTLAAWMNIKNIVDFNSVIAVHANNDDNWGFFVQDSPNRLFFKVEQNGVNVEGDSFNFNFNEWYHFVGVFDTNTSLLYVDGTLPGSSTSSNNIVVPNITTGFYIGNQQYKTSRDIPADIDDVRIYDKALNSTEVSNLYQTGSII